MLVKRTIKDLDLIKSPGSYLRKQDSSFHYWIDLSVEPWFLKPVFDAFAKAINESRNPYTMFGQAAPAVSLILQNDLKFVPQAQVFSGENGWSVTNEVMINRMIAIYKAVGRQPQFIRSPHGTARLAQLIFRKQRMPCEVQEAQLVWDHLSKVLTERRGEFRTPQAADAAVEISLIQEGIRHLDCSKVRKIITWFARVDREKFESLAPYVDPDARGVAVNTAPIEASFTRLRGPTGPIGSSRPAFTRGRGLTGGSIEKSKPGS